MDKLSYSLGTILAMNLKQQGLNAVNGDDFYKGFQTIFEGNEPEISIEEANQIVQSTMAQVAAAKNAESVKAGKEFLEKNAKNSNVITLESGLQYEVLKTGDGPKPLLTDKVTTHYEGKLIDGQIFDSSIQRGEPATFPVNGVIPGWVEALQLMNTGSKWRLFVPSNLAYGERGAGQNIGPNATLVFEVELISIA